jgi:flagellar hook protein FlgE
MMRSLFSGVSGLKTHQTRMDVIGHNIANVNTVAYKSSTMTFASLMSQTTQKASGANASTGTGGVNPRQIGLGVKTSAINVNITGQGASQSTGNPFDIMITGENFFVVNNGQENYFTRDGSFYVDGAGNLAMTSIGYNVMGWQVDEETGAIKKDTVSALRIMSSANMTYPPEATTQGYMSGIIDKLDTDVTSANGRVVNFSFFDSLGYKYTAKFVFKQSDSKAKNVYSLELDKIEDEDGNLVEMTEEQKAAVFGTANAQQDLASKVSLGTGYSWNDDVLEKDDGTGSKVPVANLADIIDNGAFKAGSEVVDDTTDPVTTVQDVLDEIAKAYGYEGSTDEFLNLRYGITDDTVSPPTTATSVRQLLLNQSGAGGTGGTDTISNVADAQTGEIEISGRYFNGVTVQYNASNGKFENINGMATASTVTLNLSGAGVGNGNFENIVIDLSGTSNVDNKGTSTIGATNGADDEFNTGSGRRNGAMIGVSIQQNGMIYASYDNGMTKLLGQIATAKFANASGLEKLADNLYSATLNSGLFDGVGVDITADGDYMSTGQLEMSNVDLSSEFTEMITTQRGFQANSRIITVSDTLLEELTNLKR